MPSGPIGTELVAQLQLGQLVDRVIAVSVDSCSREEVRRAVVEADVILLDLRAKQTDFVRYAIDAVDRWAAEQSSSSSTEDNVTATDNNLKRNSKSATAGKTVIGLSSVLTWNATRAPPLPSDQEAADSGGTVLLSSADYQSRQCSSRYEGLLALENQVLALQFPRRVSAFVVAAGLVYGGCGDAYKNDRTSLCPLMRQCLQALQASPARTPASSGLVLPLVGAGSNRLAAVHHRDLCALLASLLADPPGPAVAPYIVAVDDAHSTLLEVYHTLASGLGAVVQSVDEVCMHRADSALHCTALYRIPFHSVPPWPPHPAPSPVPFPSEALSTPIAAVYMTIFFLRFDLICLFFAFSLM